MNTVIRLLAWDAVLLHVSSALLFIGVHVLIVVHAGPDRWWVLGFLAPLLALCLAGWALQMQLLLRGTAALRRGGM